MRECVNKKTIWSKVMMLCVTMIGLMLASAVVHAEEASLSGDAENGYFINMPESGAMQLQIPENIQTFKVYDNGGVSGEYSNYYDGYIILTAPTGYVLKLMGTVITEGVQYDYLTVYDGASTEDEKLGVQEKYGSPSGTDIGTITSSGNQMRLHFCSDTTKIAAGLDLAVTLIPVETLYDITIDTPVGGAVATFVNEEKTTSVSVATTVKVVATPEDGYDLTSIEVLDENDMPIVVKGGTWYTNDVATFTMPACNARVKATFKDVSTGEDIVYQTMPATGTKELNIAADVETFKIYDDGGSEGVYSNYCSGSMVLTAPEGYIMKVTGNVIAEGNGYDYLTLYDGGNQSCEVLGTTSQYGNTDGMDIGTLVSSKNQIMLYFVSDHTSTRSGLNLTVKLIRLNDTHAIEVGSLENGVVKVTVEGSEVDVAPEGKIVTLKATPDEGYLLTGMMVEDAAGETVSLEGGTWHDGNIATFMMPDVAVKVYLTFVEKETLEDEMYKTMPVSGTVKIGIPREVPSIKIYDNGGPNEIYAANCRGYMQVSVPRGYVMKVTGMVEAEGNNYDYLSIFDGLKTTSPTLGDTSQYGTPTGVDIGTIFTSGNQLMLYFQSDNSSTYSGFDLTVENIIEEYEILCELNGGILEEGESIPSSYTVESDEITLANPVRTGYVFVGWTGTDLEEPSTNVTIPTDSIGDRSYTAIWTKKLSNEDIIVQVKEQTYSGVFNNPVVVKDGATTLVKNIDYTVCYMQDGKKVDTPVNAGNYTVLIEGVGEYCDSLEKELVIAKAESAPQIPSATMRVAYEVQTVGDVSLPADWMWKDADKLKLLPIGEVVKVTAFYDGSDKGNYINESIEISITRDECPHKWDEGVVTKEATATEKGERTFTCSVCNQTKVEEIPALGAPAAGTTQADSEGKATYKVTTSDLNNGTVTYMAPVDLKTTNITVPDTVSIGGVSYKVTAIEKNAFKNSKITKITIGNNVTTIGSNAFYSCKKLKSVKFGKNVTNIGDKAFYKCTSLATVSLPSKVKTIGKSAFEGCKKLKTVTIGKSVAKIGSKAFYGCSKIKTLTIKSTKLKAKKIGSKAFSKTPKSMTVKITKKKLKTYKPMLIKKGVNKKAKFKKA